MAPTLTALCTALALVVASHVVFDTLARLAETRFGAYLWKNQDPLRVMSSHLHVGRGGTRLLIMGASETREGLLPDEMQTAVAGLEPYQIALSMGTLDDILLALRYIDEVHGRSAVPAALLVGITPRFVANIRSPGSALVGALANYSRYDVDTAHRPWRLVPKTPVRAWQAQMRLLGQQPDRYRRGLAAFALRFGAPLAPERAAALQRRLLRPSRYYSGRWTEAEIRSWLGAQDGFWRLVYAWQPAANRDGVVAQFAELRRFAADRGVRLFVVNMPEPSAARELYPPGRYDEYLSVVRDGLGDTPFLDMRTFLRDDEIWDDAHPTWEGAIRLSRSVSSFLRGEESMVSAKWGRQ